jgi:hypothetical protein
MSPIIGAPAADNVRPISGRRRPAHELQDIAAAGPLHWQVMPPPHSQRLRRVEQTASEEVSERRSHRVDASEVVVLDDDFAGAVTDSVRVPAAVPADHEHVRDRPSARTQFGAELAVRLRRLPDAVNPVGTADAAATVGQEPSEVVGDRPERLLERPQLCFGRGGVPTILRQRRESLSN